MKNHTKLICLLNSFYVMSFSYFLIALAKEKQSLFWKKYTPIEDCYSQWRT